MKTMPFHKYQQFEPIDIPDRTWPNKVITKAPAWVSVDLRDGNQSLIEPMGMERKLKMFQKLVEIGFKEIEVGFPSASQTEFDFLRKLVDDNLIPDDVTVQVLCQAREHLIRRTFEALKGVKKAVFHLYNSTSTLQREVVFNMDKEGIKQIAIDGTKLLTELLPELPGTDLVLQYSPESFTGTEVEYAVEVCEAVMDAWQPTVENKIIFNLPATVEMSTPNIYADQVEWFSRNIKDRDKIIISLHMHNDRGTAVAAAELGLMAGADRLEGTLFGNGERTGNVDLVTVALNMFSQGVDPELDFTDINDVIKVVEYCNQLEVHPRHPYGGELVYTAFSGSHQDAIKKGMTVAKKGDEDKIWGVPYLPIDPEDLGRTYEAIIRINSQSGKGGTAYVLENTYGLSLPKTLQVEFVQVVQKISEDTEKEIMPEQIWGAFEKEYLNPNDPFTMKDYQLFSSSGEGQEMLCKTVVERDGKEHILEGKGNGPIDAYVNEMKTTFGLSFQITLYSEHAIGGGSSAKAACYIQVKNDAGDLFYGVGIHENTVTASFRAVTSAINRMLQ